VVIAVDVVAGSFLETGSHVLWFHNRYRRLRSS